MGLNAEEVKYIIYGIADAIESNKEYLTELDSAIGDADHGINMSKGFHAVSIKLKSYIDEDIGALLKMVGMTLISTVGGASGPLYGTAFMKAGAYASGKMEINLYDFTEMVSAGLEGIKMRGKAVLGDKTMIDAIEPALNTLSEQCKLNLPAGDVLETAKEAAKYGVECTKAMEARKGRASYLGQRSIGHQDPGAASSYIIFESIYKAYLKLETKKLKSRRDYL